MNTSTYEVENGKPRQIILTLIGLDIMTDYPVLNAHAILWIANGISGALGTSAPRHAAAVKRPGVGVTQRNNTVGKHARVHTLRQEHATLRRALRDARGEILIGKQNRCQRILMN